MSKYRHILFFLFWMIPGILFSQRSFLFKNFSTKNGLSQSVVTSVVQGNDNTLWIGTQDGLNRFDGYSFETYNTFNNKEITNDFIKVILKAKDGKIWFGTQDGIFSYHPNTEKFASIHYQSKTSFQVEDLVEDKIGRIWVGTYNNGLYFIDTKKNTLTNFISDESIKKISSLLLLNDETMWVNASGKLFEINLSTKHITELSFFSDKEITTLKKLSNTNILIGTTKGLYNFNLSTQLSYPVSVAFLGDKSINIIDFDENYLFVGTISDGLYVINRKYHSVIHSRKDKLNTNSISDNSINAILKDKANVIWVGTNSGLSNFNLYQSDFNFITTSEFPKIGIPDPAVWCFAENDDGRIIFVGTDKTVSFFNRSKGQFTHCPLTVNEGGKKVAVQGAVINAIKYVNEELVLVSTTKGLYKLYYNSGNPFFVRIPIKGAKNANDANSIYVIVHYKGDKYFLGTRDGVIQYDLSDNKFKFYYHKPANPENSILSGICRYIYKTNSGKLLFFTSEGGMNYYDEASDMIKPSRYNNVLFKETKEYITSALEIGDEYWFGTSGAGLLELDLDRGIAFKYDKRNGIPNNVIYGILKDRKNNIWLSSNRGISRFNPFKRISTTYFNYGDFLSSEYNQGAFFKTRRGEMFFGGVSGYVFFFPEKIHASSSNVDVSIVSLSVGNILIHPNEKNKILTRGINFTKEIKLDYRQNNISFKIASDNIGNSRMIKYKYIMDGDGRDEVVLENQNIIHFSSLQPGKYKLQIYAKIGDSNWSVSPKIVYIDISAPFWKTVWFWVTFSLVSGILTLIYVRHRIEQSRREQVILEMKIHERTEEIRNQNTEIRKQYKEISKKNTEIQNQWKIIEEKNDVLQHQKKLLESEKEKTNKLLKNILPEETFTELKIKGKVAARSYGKVSVMFADFVGFTRISEKMRPAEIVTHLDVYFTAFDKIVEEHNLEKIKTIGDAYMCAGGIPIRNLTNPIDSCLAGLKIQRFVEARRKEQELKGQTQWSIRVGINTGEITAGIIGTKKLAYDIWGSTVNMANRMEMTGKPGEVTISGTTYELIQDYFDCDFKRKVLSKSNDVVDVYIVKRIKPELSRDSSGIEPNDKFWQLVNLHLYSQINYRKAEHHIAQLLKEKLSPQLHYHCIEHTFDVVAAAERIALSEGITDENLYLLKTAALYHDAGFIERYDKNEPIGAKMAEDILPEYGYSPEQIETIKRLIFVTEVPQNPKNLLEKIICDADLDYLGRDDFEIIADKLRLELRDKGKIDSDRKWDEIQVKFLSAHRYFTNTAINSRKKKKLQHLEAIKLKLNTFQYPD